MIICTSKFRTTKIKFCFKRGKKTPLEVPFILLLMLPLRKLLWNKTKPYSENPELHNPFLSQANGISFAEEFEFILTSLLQISNRTTFFQYRSMSGGRFLVSLTEVSTSEKNWHADLCSKWETITGCKKNVNTGEGGLCGCFCSKNWS